MNRQRTIEAQQADDTRQVERHVADYAANYCRPRASRTIHETRHVSRFGQPFTLVMVESVANDVAVYEAKGHVSGEEAAAHGQKWTERNALLEGFRIPEGKHYRR